jgi:hypothetical protein
MAINVWSFTIVVTKAIDIYMVASVQLNVLYGISYLIKQ